MVLSVKKKQTVIGRLILLGLYFFFLWIRWKIITPYKCSFKDFVQFAVQFYLSVLKGKV